MSNTKIHILKKNTKGELANMYSPLQNLVLESTGLIGDMRTEKLKFNRYNPVELSITDEYDGSTNVIINDDKSNPKLINTRFSVQENKTYNIPIHAGNYVTNIYDESTFDEDAQLLKLYKNIPHLYFRGLYSGGSFKCGSYVFYFKLSDADGNLTNTVQESGIVQVHIGQPGSKKIRMGMQDENAEKCIKFELTDIDSGFDYVRIFYERVSSDESQALANTYFMIDQNFPVLDNTCEILLTGSEPVIQCSKSDLNNEFADIQTAKTQAIVDTTLFLGNVSAYEQDYQTLQSIAWSIIPYAVDGKEIGSIACNKYQTVDSNLYYDQENAYYYTGYWSDEIYRFGVVFVYNNNLLSPVFNLQGCDMNNLPSNTSSNEYWQKFFKKTDGVIAYKKWDTEPEDYFFNKDGLFNSKGVYRLPKKALYKGNKYQNMLTPNVLAIKFDLNHIIKGEKDENISPKELLRRNNIKGLFFVRQKRIPTIITQGLVIGLTGKDYGSIPVLKQGDVYNTKSFLDEHRLLNQGHTVDITSDVYNKALLIPDYEIDTATLNQFFTGSDFYIERVASTTQGWYGDSCVVNAVDTAEELSTTAKLTAVQKLTKIITDGENYFSSVAGIMDEPYKTADVNHKWNKTKPQDLTVSTSLIRGNWGSYVGISSPIFDYGDIVNIKIPECGKDNWEELEFQKRFKDYSFYSAISPRRSIEDYFDRSDPGSELCFRGDCYFNIFTHRMMSNFIDGELPTNRKIVDPGCWASNYGVRCTAEILSQTHSNLTADSDGWYIPSPNNNKSNVVSLIFGILTGNIGTIIQSSQRLSNQGNNIDEQTTFANEIVQAFEINIKDEIDPSKASIEDILANKEGNKIKKVNPKEQEAQGGINLKAIFKSDDDWELHGLASINRSDVNAVSFGQWITFPICSNYNLALRDIDFTQATEEASLNKKRSFYPWSEMNVEDHQLESEIINGAAKRTISSNGQPAFTTVPYIKQEYFNRIYWSKPNVTEQFINSFRMIFKDQYHEYNKEFGAITKLVPMPGKLLVVFQHGLGVLPVNRTPQSEQEKSPFLSSKSVLPTQVATITRDYGSMWKDSVIKTPSGIVYGVDTVAKKIWRTTGENLEFISDHKISKFLNDFIDLSEYDFNEYAGHINVKTHYNEFKHDVMFTYYKDIPMSRYTYMKNPDNGENEIVPIGTIWDNDNDCWIKPSIDTVEYEQVDLSGNLILQDALDPIPLIEKWEKGTTWSLCYNEVSGQWITFYDWYPIESCNIDNIFFSFDKESVDEVYNNDKEKPEDLIASYLESKTKPTDYFVSFSKNKVFMDKMFCENTTVYKCTCTDSMKHGVQLSLQVPEKGYYSFYYKESESGVEKTPKVEGTTPSTFEFGKDSSWRFCIAKYVENFVDRRSVLKLYIPTGCFISELHFTPYDENMDISDPVLKYSELREGFLGECLDLWKHGQSGLYDNQGKIKPTNWYGKQHEFNFEFVVNQDSQIQKIFNNLKIISNKAEPYKFEYEIVGENYDWFEYKKIIYWINKKVKEGKFTDLEDGYHYVLSTSYSQIITENLDFPKLFKAPQGGYIQKLPYLEIKLTDKKGLPDNSYSYNTYEDFAKDHWSDYSKTTDEDDYKYNTSETIIVEDEQLNEYRIHTEQFGNDIRKYGRVRGNMQYLEDLWDVEIRPVNIKYAYVLWANSNKTQTVPWIENAENPDIAKAHNIWFTKLYETRHRDKYIKVKVRYTGKDLVVIQAIQTMFNYSFA